MPDIIEQSMETARQNLRNTADTIKHELGKLPANYLAVIVVNPAKRDDAEAAVLESLIKDKTHGIYVSASKSFKDVKELVREQGLLFGEVCIVDVVTENVADVIKEDEKKGIKEEDVIFTGKVTDLVQVTIALNKAMNLFDRKDYLIVDSLSALTVGRQQKVVEKFICYITARARQWKIRTVLVIIDGLANKKLVDLLYPLVDRVIEIR